MDYEKKYNAIVRRCKELHESGNALTKQQMEIVCPELAESEDERIRKEIIDHLVKEVGLYPGEDRKEHRWLRWLEKQKECVAGSSKTSASEDEKIRKKLIDMVKRETGFTGFPSQGQVLAYLERQKEEEGYEAIPVESTLEYKLGFKAGKESEKQKEQKSAEKSDTEVLVMKLNNLLIGYGFNKDISMTVANRIADTYGAQRYMDGLCDGLKHNENPAEWSEEDRDKVAQYLHDLDGGMLWSKATEITSDILDILHPQPKAELTLLDENIIKAAVAFVEQNDHFNCWGGIDKHTVIKALRSLKPSWKPSEAQMSCLKEAIVHTTGYSWSMCLPELYEQLKKLM